MIATLPSYSPNGGGVDGDPNRDPLNAAIRAGIGPTGCTLVDLAQDIQCGADGTYVSTVCFVDALHPTDAGDYNDFIPIWDRVYNRLNGNTSFSTANTYTASAAGVLDTAESETGNTMTFTSTLNPGAGAIVVCTGSTVTGYNSPTETGWFVITSGASSFTAWNNTTGLAAGSGTHATCVAPLQKDVDDHSTLGASSGSQTATLEPYRIHESQPTYIWNTDTHSWTITPFGGSKINTASTFTLAAGAQIKLTSVFRGAV